MVGLTLAEGSADGIEAGEGSFAAEDVECEVKCGGEGGKGDGDADEAKEFGGFFAGVDEELVKSVLESDFVPVGKVGQGGDDSGEEGD